MNGLALLYTYIGPALWGLLPISVTALALLFHVLLARRQGRNVDPWVPVILAHCKETATLLGLLGSVYALTASFRVDGASPEEIRSRMFFIMSTGFWSTIGGVLVSIECSLGLLALKQT